MESKKNKPKADKFPETALAFYIKLYCKQKGSSETKYHSNLIEATKSWLSLTEEERQQVHKSYREKEHKYKQQCFDQLKNAETFMKVKDQTGLKNADLNSSNSVIQEPEEYINNEKRLRTETEHPSQIVNDEDMYLSYDGDLVTNTSEPEHDQEVHNETIREPVQQTNDEIPRTFLVEPLPPTLKTSKDLFYMLHPAGGAENVSWTTLPISEKNQYGRAVSLLKTDYITKYKEYLESLTPRELFDYYNKTLF